MVNRKPEFMECDTCRAKPGSPTLCSGCLHNRSIITQIIHNSDLPTTAELDTMIRNMVTESEARFKNIKKGALDAVRRGQVSPEESIRGVNQAYLGHLEVLKAVRSIS